MTEISLKEISLLEQLRDRIKDIDLDPEIFSDVYLVRFLRARDHDLKNVEQMFRKHIIWRIDNGLDKDKILEWDPPEILTRTLQYEFCGVDKDGDPLLLVPFGQWDVKGAIEAVGKEQYLKFVYQFLTKCMKTLLKQSRFQHFVLLMIPDDLQMLRQISSTQVIESVLEIFRNYESNCPETLKAAYVVDVPYMFSVGYKLVKPIIHSRTLSKITIASNVNSWKPSLHELVSPDQLPVRLGGTRHSTIESFNKVK